ncbi:type II toxin-antitoxin system RelE/ParE family toxin [Spongiibacter sp. KMU-158]|uniref:Type II toxin-antitoxin system RelE/ParE family toxin n=1 Tax=Spongiibacter pelagi TaxID=2760804 RepID=A0A927C1U5_9GAMM|nr:type II toxin-antitoxin system RelE/ParE family toxin [Spongiibacter pelagi]MBD2857950.1 type II toxin-antitoxin system RelE/ParE family toxin [Spongiibacter pelagi]
MQFIETPVFSRWLKANVSDEDFYRLQLELVADPRKGDVIKGTGGFRKIRIAYGEHGKRGGGRVIYYWFNEDQQVYLVMGYCKGEKSDLSEQEKQILKELAYQLKGK